MATVLDRLERREAIIAAEGTPVSHAFTLLEALGGGEPSYTGRRVTQKRARTYSVVFNAITLSSGWVGSLPCKLFRSRDDGGKEEAREHPAHQVMRWRPNPRMSAMAYKEAKHAHVLTRGTGYSEIVRNGRGQVVELWPLNPDQTRSRTLDDGTLVFETNIDGERILLPEQKVLHVPGLGSDGLTGWSVISLARQSIALGLGMEEYSARFFGNASTPRGVLTTDGQLDDEAAKKLKSRWEQAQGGLDQAHRVAVLEDGLTFDSIGLSAEDAQLIEGREFGVDEVARWFNLPSSKLKASRAEPRANVEQENINAKTDHLVPWVTRWEQALTNQLLTERERQEGLFFEFQLQGFERGDMDARGSFYSELFGAAAITPNEIRSKENMNPIEGGDTAFVQMQDIPVDQAGSLSASERAMVVAAGQGDGDALRAVAEVRRLELEDAREGRKLLASGESRQDEVGAQLRLRRSFRPLLREAFGRMVRAESQDLLSEAPRLFEQGPNAVLRFLDHFYAREGPIAGIIDRTARTTMEAYAQASWDAALEQVDAEDVKDRRLDEFMRGPTGYIATYRKSYSASGRGQLQSLVTEADDPRTAFEQRLDEWQHGGGAEGAPEDRPTRAEKQANKQTVKLGEATRMMAWGAAGVASKMWRTTGPSDCPMCEKLEGTIVRIRSTFVDQGSELVGTDDTTTIIPSNPVRHAPLHGGCDCLLVPVL